MRRRCDLSSIDAERTLLEHWDGQRWKVMRMPGDAVASSIAADSASDVWAIAEKSSTNAQGYPVYTPVVDHFDGSTWSQQSTLPLSAEYGYGDVRIAALSPSDVWAFILHGERKGATPVFEHWNGKAWSQVQGASLFTSDSYESFGLAFAGAHDGWLIGNHTTSGAGLAEHWNGVSWTAVKVPVSGDLYAAAAVPAGGFWAVGIVVDPYKGYAQTRIDQGP